MAPDPAYIHCSWNVNNDQFWPMTDLRPVGTKCEAEMRGVVEDGGWRGEGVGLEGTGMGQSD